MNNLYASSPATGALRTRTRKSLRLFIAVVVLLLHVILFLVLAELVEHELLLILHEELRRALDVDEKRVNALDIVDVDLGALALLAAERRAHDHVDRVSQGRLERDAREEVERLGQHLDVLILAADLEDAPHLGLLVRRGRDDHQAVEQVERDAVRALVLRAADLRDAAIRRDDEHGREVALERTVEPREALDVEHVHLVDEEHARDDRRLALFTPLGDLRVDLLA